MKRHLPAASENVSVPGSANTLWLYVAIPALGGGVVERDVSGLLDAMFAAPEFEEEERAGRADAA